MMSVTLDDKRPSYSTVKSWVARFRKGHLSTEDEERSGRPAQGTIPENVDTIYAMILDDRIVPAKRIPWQYPKKKYAILFTRF
jgi:hypothetical protein